MVITGNKENEAAGSGYAAAFRRRQQLSKPESGRNNLRTRASSRQDSVASKRALLTSGNGVRASLGASVQLNSLATPRAAAALKAGGVRSGGGSPTTSIGDEQLDLADRLLREELSQYDLQLAHRQQLAHLSTPSTLLSGGSTAKWPNQLLAGAVVGALPLPAAGEAQGPEGREASSIVAGVVMATGQGCRDVVAPDDTTALPQGACWTSRSHRVLQLESCCMLQLRRRRSEDVVVRITFADAASVPQGVRFEHAPSPTAAFQQLGEVCLQQKSLQRLRHLFRLGQHSEVQRCFRITLLGHLTQENSGAHRVSHILITGSRATGASRTPSPDPEAASAQPVAGSHNDLASSSQAGSLARLPQSSYGSEGGAMVPTSQGKEAASAAGAAGDVAARHAAPLQLAAAPIPAAQPPASALGDSSLQQEVPAPVSLAAALPLAGLQRPESEPASLRHSLAALEPAALVAPGNQDTGSKSSPAPQQERAVPSGPSPAELHAQQLKARACAVESSAFLLSAACREVYSCELLEGALKVAELIGGFLNAGNREGAAAGFQVDALLRLKDVRSTRARSPTLLHVLAREVCKLLGGTAPLLAAQLPSCAAATGVDLAALRGELEEVALPLSGSKQGTFQDQLTAAQAALTGAEAAFSQLATHINGQRATMREPAAFFGVLHAFGQELEAAHAENAAADAAAGKDKQKAGVRRRTATGSLDALPPRRRGPVTADAANPLHLSAASMVRPCTSAEEQEASGTSARSSGALPVESSIAVKAVIEVEGHSPRLRDGQVAGHLRVQAPQGAAAVVSSQQRALLSTPVAQMLAESARLLTSVDGPLGGLAAAGAAGGLADERQLGGGPEEEQVQPMQQYRDSGQQDAVPDPEAEEQQQAALDLPEAASPPPQALGRQMGAQLSMNELWQRNLQLSPASTPLSSLGRQSSRSSMGSGSCCSLGSTPPSRARAALGQRGASPLGVASAAAVAIDAAGQAQLLGPGGAVQAGAPQPRGEFGEGLLSPGWAGATVCEEAGREQAAEARGAAGEHRAGFAALNSVASSYSNPAFDTTPRQLESEGSEQQLSPQQGAQPASLPPRQELLQEQWPEQLGGTRGSQLQVSNGRLPSVQGGMPSEPSGPLQQQQAPHGILKHSAGNSLRSSSQAGAYCGGKKRVSFSLPGSPTHPRGLGTREGGAAAPLLDLRAVADRLVAAEEWQERRARLSQEGRQVAAQEVWSDEEEEQQEHGLLSPTLEALLQNVPTPKPLAEREEWLLQEELDALHRHQLRVWQPEHSGGPGAGALQQQQPSWRSQGDDPEEQLLWQQLQQLELAEQQLQQGPAQEQLGGKGPKGSGLGGASLPSDNPWPSPGNLDAKLAAVLAQAGNSPTGPLARGVREEATFKGMPESALLRASGNSQGSRGGGTLEPLAAPPLGEGLRRSHTLGEGIPQVLRASVDGSLIMLQHHAEVQQAEAEQQWREQALLEGSEAGSYGEQDVAGDGGGAAVGGWQRRSQDRGPHAAHPEAASMRRSGMRSSSIGGGSSRFSPYSKGGGSRGVRGGLRKLLGMKRTY